MLLSLFLQDLNVITLAPILEGSCLLDLGIILQLAESIACIAMRTPGIFSQFTWHGVGSAALAELGAGPCLLQHFQMSRAMHRWCSTQQLELGISLHESSRCLNDFHICFCLDHGRVHCCKRLRLLNSKTIQHERSSSILPARLRCSSAERHLVQIGKERHVRSACGK